MTWTSRCVRLFSLGCGVLAFGAGVAPAQIARALLRQGDPLPAWPGHVVSALRSTAVNRVGGHVVTVSTWDGASGIDLAWGDSTGAGSPGTIFQQGVFPPYTQDWWSGGYAGIDDLGRVVYDASVSVGGVAQGSSVWVDSTPVAVAGEASVVPGKYWTFASSLGMTASGEPWFYAGLASAPDGNTETRGLFRGTSPAPILLGGDALPNLPFPLQRGHFLRRARLSHDGAHFVAEVKMETGSGANDNAIVIDSVGLVLGGALVREGNTIPVTIGGDGAEKWDNFRAVGHDSSGRWFLAGTSNLPGVGPRQIVVVDGSLVHRSGQRLGNLLLSEFIDGGFLTESGQLALIWGIEHPTRGHAEALFVEGRPVLVTGDPVDFDGDGSLDVGAILTSFRVDSLSMGEANDVYFLADVDVQGTATPSDDVAGLYVIDCSIACGPVVYCTAGTTANGCRARIAAAGAASASAPGGFEIVVDGVEGDRNGILFYGTSGRLASPWGMGAMASTSYLCVKAPIQRTAPQASGGTSGSCDGVLALDWNAYRNANPGAHGAPFGAGDVVEAQAWFRDPLSPNTTSLSDGLEFTLAP